MAPIPKYDFLRFLPEWAPILFQDPYPFFKGVFANFSAISLADNSAGFAHVNGGVWYVQDAAHGGPVQRMFREFERRTLSLLDGSRPCAPTSNLQIARQLTCLVGRALGRTLRYLSSKKRDVGRPADCLLYDQQVINDVLYSFHLGREAAFLSFTTLDVKQVCQ